MTLLLWDEVATMRTGIGTSLTSSPSLRMSGVRGRRWGTRSSRRTMSFFCSRTAGMVLKLKNSRTNAGATRLQISSSQRRSLLTSSYAVGPSEVPLPFSSLALTFCLLHPLPSPFSKLAKNPSPAPPPPPNPPPTLRQHSIHARRPTGPHLPQPKHTPYI